MMRDISLNSLLYDIVFCVGVLDNFDKLNDKSINSELSVITCPDSDPERWFGDLPPPPSIFWKLMGKKISVEFSQEIRTETRNF